MATMKEQRAETARKHLKDIEIRLRKNIGESYAATITYGDDKTGTAAIHGEAVRIPERLEEPRKTKTTPEEIVMDIDTVSAIISEKGRDSRNSICVLNFASYTHPGGGFLKGSMAQEEALCHKSTLYPVLKKCEPYYAWNAEHRNNGMYKNRALFSKNILFEDGSKQAFADVISCAAPNKSAAPVPKIRREREYQRKVLEDRIRFVFAIAKENHPDVLILGAWGCGVFRQDPKEVASIMHEMAGLYRPAKCIVYAVPAAGCGKENHDAFVRTIRGI